MATEVTTFAVPAGDASRPTSRVPRHLALRLSCWAVALSLGAWQAWATRFAMNPDGVSYLDIGDAYWRGDWHNAINAYWSPLYSWILGFFLKVFHPSICWEYPLVHLVNFLIYVGALAAFEFFVSSFIAERREHNRALYAQGEICLSPELFYLVGYSLFIWTSTVLVGLALVSPDMLVFLFVCLDCALLILSRRNPSTRKFALLGAALGFGYLAKAVLFPLGAVFLAAALFSTTARRMVIISGMIFLAIATPFIAAISFQKHRPTFGDSGRIAYAAYISNLEFLFPGDGGDFYPDGIGHAENIANYSAFSKQLTHPVKRVFDDPAAYSFGLHTAGTHPFWFDPSYWQEGVRPAFNLSRQLQVSGYAIAYLLVLTFGLFYQLAVTVILLLLFLLAPRPSTCLAAAAEVWYLLAPIVIAILMYAIVHLEYRYIAPFICVGWIVLFSGVRLPFSNNLRFVMRFAVFFAALSQTVLAGATTYNVLNRARHYSRYVDAAEALRRQEVGPGTKIALISDDPLGQGGTFVARLARTQVVAQVNDPMKFWSSPQVQPDVLEALAKAGAEVALTWRENPKPKNWQQLDGSSYFIKRLTK